MTVLQRSRYTNVLIYLFLPLSNSPPPPASPSATSIPARRKDRLIPALQPSSPSTPAPPAVSLLSIPSPGHAFPVHLFRRLIHSHATRRPHSCTWYSRPRASCHGTLSFGSVPTFLSPSPSPHALLSPRSSITPCRHWTRWSAQCHCSLTCGEGPISRSSALYLFLTLSLSLSAFTSRSFQVLGKDYL